MKKINTWLSDLSRRIAPDRSLERYRRLDEFIARRLREDIYPEIPDPGHLEITRRMIEHIAERWGLAGRRVLDVGCGQGQALELFAAQGAVPTGLTFGADFEECQRKGLDVIEMEMSFLEFPEETFDLIWARHALEHSLFPYFTLVGLYTALKPGGLLYVEVPASDTCAQHQRNRNHYSCLTRSSWLSLFERTGFVVEESHDIHVQLKCGPDVWFSFSMSRPALGESEKSPTL